MSKKVVFIGLVLIAVIIAAVDFVVNDYSRFLNTPEEETVIPLSPTNHITESFKNTLPEDVIIQETVETPSLFSRLDISALNLDESLQTTLTQGVQKFGLIYEFSGGENTYFQIKSALELILTEDDSVFDANNLGDYSLYYNDARRTDTVFLLALINGRIWGFEYPREYHDIFKELTKTLVEQESL